MVETTGSVPLALPGGLGQASRPNLKPSRPLVLRTPAKSLAAFATPRRTGVATPAFWKTGKKAFGK
jgi:hypothetical protein